MKAAYFFCGIGGSGMLPLAVLLAKRGHSVLGSDRSRDQGKLAEKFSALEEIGITLFPQDGSGVSQADILVVSSAVEESIPDVRTAMERDTPIIKRGTLLAELFNTAEHKIAVAGTSGKSTITGMIGTMLAGMEQNPTVVNGGEIRNFGDKFSGIRKGRNDLFIAEMDESDGSIAHYNPSVAVLNNIALDHKSMEELETLFGDYLARTSSVVIVNFDQPRVKDLTQRHAGTAQIISYAINGPNATLHAVDLCPRQTGMDFTLKMQGLSLPVHLNVAGRHNVENALACLSVCLAMGLDIKEGIKALQGFKGIHRRMELIGEKNGITVIDDFAHNPDKINASLETLKAFEGRLIVMFQPHGFGPLRLMGQEMVEVFARHLGKDDVLLMPEAYYAGGTVDRSVTAKHLIADLQGKGVQAHWFETRGEIPAFIQKNTQKGDRIVIMGARDDTLHTFARDIFEMNMLSEKDIWADTLRQLEYTNYQKCPNLKPFETFRRLLYKAKFGENPNDPCKQMDIDESAIKSYRQKRMVNDLYNFKDSMPKKHYDKTPNKNGVENAVIIVRHEEKDFLIDGSNRINYWYSIDPKKILLVNYHEINL